MIKIACEHIRNNILYLRVLVNFCIIPNSDDAMDKNIFSQKFAMSRYITPEFTTMCAIITIIYASLRPLSDSMAVSSSKLPGGSDSKAETSIVGYSVKNCTMYFQHDMTHGHYIMIS
ncbi:uncharacterized protein EV154DRAFT_557413 [Mucor mucedo]|uniref:uncharacterized protein n=1 Tax=Mucor mucedo TaxID=29922 RepID=UPI00221E7031|nr:uncharacterized protein EV154DRAFT_557413 [Mucor mucedo]KAI7863452.1 hypothetical protein EV154DRAFT_557413 [Mucor mucedo]